MAEVRTAVVTLMSMMMMACLDRTIRIYATPEQRAMRAIDELIYAEEQFLQQMGRHGSLDELAKSASPSLATLLRSAENSDYVVSLEVHGRSYVIRASPKLHQRGKPGWQRTFYADETKVLRQSWTAADANENSPAVPRSPSRLGTPRTSQ